MAFRYSPKIITDGLVLALDAANKKSYPGSGTVWKDLSGNGNNGTLVNGPTFDEANGGSIVFDGVDDYVENDNFLDLTGTDLTITFWTKPTFFPTVDFSNVFNITNVTGGSRVNVLICQYRKGSSKESGKAPFTFFSQDNFTSSELNSPQVEPGYWYNYQATLTNTEAKLYFNGELVDSTTDISGYLTTSTNILRLSRNANNSNDNVYAGSTSIFTIYNRVLTDQEITQNYNALKGRFGL